MPVKKDPRLARAGVSGYNKPKRTPNHPKKSHVVVAKEGDKIKTIRFGEQGASTAGKPKAGESARMKAKRKSFKARHGKNIAKGKKVGETDKQADTVAILGLFGGLLIWLHVSLLFSMLANHGWNLIGL